MLFTRLDKRKAQRPGIPAQQLHSLLDGDRVDLTEQCVDQVVVLELHGSGFRLAVFKAQLRQVMRFLRGNVGKD